MLLLMCHWLGCGWWFVADMELSESPTPSVPMNSWQPSTALLTVRRSARSSRPRSSAPHGHGDGAARHRAATEVEVYFTSLRMVVGLVINAFVIGAAASALAQID